METSAALVTFALTILGLLFAFQAPRKWFVELFSKTPDLTHEMTIRTVIHAHNRGSPLAANENITETKNVLTWEISNNTDLPLQFERGLVLKQAQEGLPDILLTLSQQSTETAIPPRHKLSLLTLELTHQEVDHLRHWVREARAFGLRLTDGRVFWIPADRFVAIGVRLQQLAEAYGLSAQVSEGTMIGIRIRRDG